MIIGIPKEIKNNENRVGITPTGVQLFVTQGHQVQIETNAGLTAGFTDEAYEEMGATIVNAPQEAWAADMVIKVKEPLPSEYVYLREDLILYTYLHLAPAKELTDALLLHKTTSIAYETVQLSDNSLPLLTPMSEIAGRMSVQIGAEFLEKPKGGKGILLSGIPGVHRGNIVIIGGGNVGTNAAKIAIGMGANVTILDISPRRLGQLDDLFGHNIQTLLSNPINIARAVKEADLVIGTVLIPGAKTPTLVTKEMVQSMEAGSVIIDVAIDQGGCIETIDHITTHDEPVYERYGVLHYAVANMPGAVAKTSTVALTNVTLPYALEIANKGLPQVALENEALAKGLNTYQGHLVNSSVAHSQNRELTDFQTLV